MLPAHGAHVAAFQTEYRAILERALWTVSRFPPTLHSLIEPLVHQLAEGSFSSVVALLPYWVADLLDELSPLADVGSALRHEETETLGLANLLGWWSYLIQDRLLDREWERLELLPVSTALYAAAVRLLASLLPGDRMFWEAFESLSLASIKAHFGARCRHFQVYADLDERVLDHRAFDLDVQACLADRSALLRLSSVAQFALRGYDQNQPVCPAVHGLLRHYAVARQIGDDLTDWVEDLERGCLNYVSSCIVRRMKDTGVIQNYGELDTERIIGYFLYDDELFTAIQREALAACQRAAQPIAPYKARYLSALVGELTDRVEQRSAVALDQRRKLQELFSPFSL
jgi:hypothetical protein